MEGAGRTSFAGSRARPGRVDSRISCWTTPGVSGWPPPARDYCASTSRRRTNPQFRQYGRSDGLSSLNLYSLAEDRNGSIYIGTGGGVDRLDPDLAHIRHYTPADGIAPGQVFAAYRDHAGAIWFGSTHGLTRLVPQNGPASDPPPVWITGVSIAGALRRFRRRASRAFAASR